MDNRRVHSRPTEYLAGVCCDRVNTHLHGHAIGTRFGGTASNCEFLMPEGPNRDVCRGGTHVSRRGAVTLVVALMLALTGCTPGPSESTVKGRAWKPPGPAAGHVPVPSDRANWSATGQEPEAVARAFTLADNSDCDRVTVKSEAQTVGRVNVAVRLEGLKDDSVKNMEYLVVLKQTGGLWKVESATYIGLFDGTKQNYGGAWAMHKLMRLRLLVGWKQGSMVSCPDFPFVLCFRHEELPAGALALGMRINLPGG